MAFSHKTPLAPISESACPVKLKKHFIGVCYEAEKLSEPLIKYDEMIFMMVAI
jgi:hypothetical protein